MRVIARIERPSAKACTALSQFPITHIYRQHHATGRLWRIQPLDDAASQQVGGRDDGRPKATAPDVLTPGNAPAIAS
jgi:hypothetical protein